jgi:hypothetical protein
MKLLEEDPAETTRDILYTISQQLANSSTPPFPKVHHETPLYAVVVNGFFFASLSCSLIAALLAVLALQWVANYDMGLNTSSAQKRALQRHTRWTGIEKWKMGEIIASLPLLIFISLFLFFIGIADWLWHLNQAISAIAIGCIGVGFLVYSITTIISIVNLEAPFRTPVSKGLAPLIRRALSWTKLLVWALPSEIIKRNEVPYRIGWARIREIWNNVYSNTPVLPQSFSKCEELAVEGKEEAGVESLIWLANSIEVSLASYSQFSILTKELSQLPGESLLRGETIHQASWESIFELLSSPYLGRKSIKEYTADEVKAMRDICKSFSMISSGINCPSLSTICEAITGADPLIDIAFDLMMYRHLDTSNYWLQIVLNHVRHSISSAEGSYLHFILLTAQQSWPNLGDMRREVLDALMEVCTMSFYSNRDPYPIPIQDLHIILDLVGRQDEGQSKPTNTPRDSTAVGRYISTIKQMKGGVGGYLGNEIHQAIQQQLLLHISVIDFSLPSAINDLNVPLDLLLQLVSSKTLALVDRERDEFIHLLTKIGWDSHGPLLNTVQEALLTGLQHSYGTDDQPFSRWTSLVLAFDEYLERKNLLSEDDPPYITRILCLNPPEHNTYQPEASLRERLTRVKDPSIALWLAEYCPYDWEFEVLIHPDISKWNYRVLWSMDFVRDQKGLIRVDLHIPLLRTIINDGPFRAQRSAISFLESQCRPCIFNTEQVIRLILITTKSLIDLFTRVGRKYYLVQFLIGSFNTMLWGVLTG